MNSADDSADDSADTRAASRGADGSAGSRRSRFGEEGSNRRQSHGLQPLAGTSVGLAAATAVAVGIVIVVGQQQGRPDVLPAEVLGQQPNSLPSDK